MTPNQRLMQRLGVDASKTAKQPAPKAVERTAATEFRGRLGVKEPAAPDQAKVQAQATAREAAITRAKNVFQVNKGSPAITALTMGKTPEKTQQQAQGRPADRLTSRLATPASNSPSQGRPAPSAQRQQQQGPSRPTERLTARLASGGTEKVAAAVQQQKQRGPMSGRGM